MNFYVCLVPFPACVFSSRRDYSMLRQKDHKTTLPFHRLGETADWIRKNERHS